MKYTITRETSRILKELTKLAESLQEQLPSISPEARSEWDELRLRWPSELEVRQGTIALTEDELSIMESKVRRFHDILTARSSSPRNTGASDDGDMAELVPPSERGLA